MNVKNIKYTFKGVNRDVNSHDHPFEYLYGATNIRFLTTDKRITGSFAFEKGNSLEVTIPTVTINRTNNTIDYEASDLSSALIHYTNGTEIDTDTSIPTSSTSQKIIGHTVTRDSVILFTTDGNNMDCIWRVNNTTFIIELLYVRNLGFSEQFPIQALFNYENENIQKVYWVDGTNQIRFINLEHDSIEGNEALIDVPSTALNFVGVIDFSQPIISSIAGGGTHTAGMIQYAYNLYRLNSSQTKLSPISELVPLGKNNGLGGGELNDIVGAAPVVQINDIDSSYTHIKVYAIKYTSLNQTPSISLIEERELDGQTSITVFDDGSTISTLSLEELLFLGSDPYVAKHIEAKDNSLFLFNVQNKNFILPEDLDCRAYSFPSSSTSTPIYDNVSANSGGIPIGDVLTVNSDYLVPKKHDAVNLNYDTHKYQYNSTTLGGEGKFIKYEIVTNPTLTNDVDTYRFFKDREIYRIGVQFYNRLGQTSLPKWIADFMSPSSNLEGEYGTLKVELKSEFYTWLNAQTFDSEDDRPVGYKIIRANRTINDKTILCQGIVSTMMVNSPRESESAELYNLNQKRSDSQIQAKLPNILLRTFEDITPLKATSHLEAMQFGSSGGTTNPLTEIQYDGSERKADTYQYTAMHQMYSPEILFGSLSLNNNTKLKVIGGVDNTFNAWWGQERRIDNKITEGEAKTLNKITPHTGGGTTISINGPATNLMDRGLISETNGTDPDVLVEFNQWYRELTTFNESSNKPEYEIYGTPELTVRGQGRTIYNNNSKYEYSNTLEGFLTDGEDEFDEDGALDRTIVSLNSYGTQCVTMVLDDGSQTDIDPHLRPLTEQLYTQANLNDTSNVLLTELVRPEHDKYLAALYGGNTYEDKKRTTYIPIGEYKDIATTSVQINSPGDTYVQTFKFLRIGKTDLEIYTSGVNQISEIISFPVETSIDIKNRHDISITEWDSDFQPRYDDYHLYNTVYSQQPIVRTNTDSDFNFRRIQNFDTRIQATKIKIPNETIDSWTDVLTNEVMDLDGKYGPINAVASFRDQIFTFQDNALALIGINPRVQIQATDGVSMELGTGSKLYDYQYISTKSGSLNKWGVIASEMGLYYLDGLNKRMYRYSSSLEPLSEVKGFHEYLENNLSIASLRIDNPLLAQGVSMGYDQKNNDIYLTYNNTWTLVFNEFLNEYTGFYSYNSPMYIFNKESFLTLNPGDRQELYLTHGGNYNEFYGVNQASNITLIANPENDHECMFNNLEWKSEAEIVNSITNSGEINYTWETVRVSNEFQDSGIKEINKIRRLNRKHRMALPRNANSRDRIRSNWAFITLEANNLEGHFYLNHDIILYYIPNYVIIR